MTSFTPAPKPRPSSRKGRTGIARSRVKPRNAKRYAANLLRAYGPENRRDWMRNQDCLGCGRAGYSVSAHIVGGGGSRKASYTKTIPLCCLSRLGVDGCHQKFDRYEDIGFTRGTAGVDALATVTETCWRATQSRVRSFDTPHTPGTP